MASAQQKLILTPRKKPVNEWEEEALEEYERRGYQVEWMPTAHPFDFIVNGHRVDVKGTWDWLDKTVRRFHFAISTAKQGPHTLKERCDIYHCIGFMEGVEPVHYMIPSCAVVGKLSVNMRTDMAGRQTWSPFHDRWDMLAPGTDLQGMYEEPISVYVGAPLGGGTATPAVAVSFRLLPEDKALLDKLCLKHDMPQAAVIGAALRAWAKAKK